MSGPLRPPVRAASPPLDFAFTNPSARQPQKVSTRPATTHQLPFDTPNSKPHPSSKQSSSLNAFGLSTNRRRSSPSPSSNSLLRREVFKSTHTSSPSAQPSHASLADPPLSTHRVPPAEATSLKLSNAPRQLRSGASLGQPTSSPFIKFESSPPPKKTNPHDANLQKGWGMDHFDHSIPLASPDRLSPVAPDSAVGCLDSDANLVDLTGQTPIPTSLRSTPHEPGLPPKTPSRRNLDRNTLTNDHKTARPEVEEVLADYQQLITHHEALKHKHATISKISQERREENERLQETIHSLESQLADGLDREKKLQAEADSLQERGATIEHLSAELAASRQDACDANAANEESERQLRESITEHESNCAELKASLHEQQGVSDLLREELSRARGNYSESLDQNTKLQTWLATMTSEQKKTAESIAELYKKLDKVVDENSILRTAEGSTVERARDLENKISSLANENAHTRTLFEEEKQALLKKLKGSEDEKGATRREWESTHADLTQKSLLLQHLRSSHDEVLVQLEIHRREESEAKEQASQLFRDVEHKTQLLEETRKANELSILRLSEAKQDLDRAKEETSVLQGRIVELEKARCTQSGELSVAKSDLTDLNAELLVLREKLSQASIIGEELNSLRAILSETDLKLDHQISKSSNLEEQLEELKGLHDTRATERDSLLALIRASDERETQFQHEFKDLREAAQCASAELAQAQALYKLEESNRKAAEEKLEISVRTVDELKSKEHVYLSEISAQRTVTSRLENELSLSTSTKATLEKVLADIRAMNQQEASIVRRESDQKISVLLAESSDQKARIDSLTQQLAAANTRNLEHKAEANAHRSEVEATRASVAFVEYRLKEKEKELSELRLQVRELESASAQSAAGIDQALKARVSEQDSVIEGLNAEITTMKRDVESISERYRNGKLTEPEKAFVTEIIASLQQEKNRAINALRGDLKGKDNEIASHKATIAACRENLSKRIQEDTLNAQLRELKGDAHSTDYGIRGVILEMHQFPSSSLSEAPAPDHDQPTPDTPTVPSKSAQPIAPRQPLISTKQKPQQHRTFAEIEQNHTNGLDEIQDFEESELPHLSRSASRKRHVADVEPTDEQTPEQPSGRRKGTAKRATKDATGTRGKAGKRRKA